MAQQCLDTAALIEALTRPAAYPRPVQDVEVHQTHISVVFLAGEFAYKIKKPVSLGFLDFSTLEKRKHFCEEEVRLNRRLAPDVYLGVVPIVQHVGQAARLPHDEDGKRVACPTEWAVKMRRLPNDATLEHRLQKGDVSENQICALAERLAMFHRDADTNERISSLGCFEVVARNARENFTQAAGLAGVTVHAEVFERARALTEAHLARLHDLIESRAMKNVPRDTHGDLRLDHVYFFPDAPPPGDMVIIDCIEFSDRFRFADPIADMAFLYMDLTFHGRRDLARVFADAYFRASGDDSGRDLLHFYSAYRAIIRAKVEGIELSEKEIDRSEREEAFQRARAHWLLALGDLETPRNRPALVLVAGLPGVGKSTIAQAIAHSSNFAVIRSDVVRKEIAQGAGRIYSPQWTEKTYSTLLERAERSLWEGKRVLIDANFRADDWRVRFLEMARRWAVPVLFVHCHADAAIIRERLDARKNDVSDADWKIYQQLESSWQPLSAEIRAIVFDVDTSGDLATSEKAVFDRLRRSGFLA